MLTKKHQNTVQACIVEFRTYFSRTDHLNMRRKKRQTVYTHLAVSVATVSPKFGRRAVAPAWPLLQVWGLVWRCRWGSLRPERWQWGKSWGMNRLLGCPLDAVLPASQMFWGSATHRAAWRSSAAPGCIRSAPASAHVPPGPASTHFCCDPLRPVASAGLRPGNFWPCSVGRTQNTRMMKFVEGESMRADRPVTMLRTYMSRFVLTAKSKSKEKWYY